MKQILLSSGDLLADRRANYAEMLLESGDADAAADLMRDALARAPAWAAGWFRLGEMLEEAGRTAEAEAAWREALRLDPADRLGATMKLSLAGAAAGIIAPPAAFVEALFDQYAENFDAALVERLEYRVPDLLFAALREAGCDAFAHVIDLGCGTGLMGDRLRGIASYMEGFDISAGMLRQAEKKRVYDRLERRDLQTLPPAPSIADLVTAADVLMYIGQLEALFSSVAGLVLPGGLFAFSVELLEGPGELVLRPSRRYAHSAAYVTKALAQAGFDIVASSITDIRKDRGEPIKGLLVIARRGVDSHARLQVPVRPELETEPVLLQ